MKVICGLRRLKQYRRPIVALGVFDGMHRAHRRILQETIAYARKIKGTSIAVTFFPHPRREESLYSLEHRLRLMSQLGLDICIVIRFNRKFSRISAEDFVYDILVGKIRVAYLYVGKNFRFGKSAAGDIRTLRRLSAIYGFGLRVFDVIRLNNKPISSTYIRKLVTRGKLGLAKNLLLRPVSVLGTVIKGAYLGSKLGFPTANINPHHEVLPPSGVYTVRVNLEVKRFKGVCYIGTRPTFRIRKNGKRAHNRQRGHVEVHIFNFKKNIYGKYLEIQFIKRIRDERKFPSPQALAEQIKKDILVAKKIFSLHRYSPQYMPV